jgi:hypothetical protein
MGVEFNASALESKGLSGILQELDSKGLATAENLIKLFGSTEAVAAVMPAAGAGAALFASNLDAINNSAGAAAAGAEKVGGTFDKSVERILNQVNNLLVKVGTGVQKSLAPIIAIVDGLVKVFSLLPTPVLELAGVLITVTGGALTVTSALLAMAAVIPILTTGYNFLRATLLANQAVLLATGKANGILNAASLITNATISKQSISTGLNTAVTSANAVVKNILVGINLKLGASSTAVSAGTIKENAAMAINLAGTKALAIAKSLLNGTMLAGAKSSLANIGALGKLGITAGLVVGAAIALNEAWKSLAAGLGLESKRGASEAVESLTDLRAEINQTKETAEESSGGFAAFARGLGLVSREEVKAQNQIIQLGRVTEETGKIFDEGNATLSKYGLGIVDAGKEVTLSESQIASFNTEAEKHIKMLDASKQALRDYAAANPEAAKAVEAEIAVIDKQIATYQDRINQLKENGKVVGKSNDENAATVKSLEEVNLALEKLGKDTGLSDAKGIAGIKESVASGAKSVEKGNAEIEALEKASIQKRITENQKALKDLETAKIGAAPETVKEINDRIYEIDSDTTKARIELADKVATANEAAATRAITAITDVKEAAVSTADNTAQRETNTAKRGLLSGKSTESEVDDSIAKAEIKAGEARISAIKKEQEEIEALRDSGVITAEDAAKRLLAIEGELVSAEGEVLDARITQREAAVNRLKEASEKEIDAAEKSVKEVEIAAKEAQLAGGSPSDVQAKRVDAQVKASKEIITILNNEKSEIDKLRADGTISADVAAERIKEIDNQILEAKSESLDAQIEQQQKANDLILKGIQDANRKAETEIASSTRRQNQAIRAAVISGYKTTEDAALASVDAALATNQKQIDLISNRIKETNRLEMEGVISAQDARDRRIDLEGELGSAQLDRIDLVLDREEAANNAVISSMRKQADLEKQSLTNLAAAVDLVKDRYNAQEALISQQLRLEQALNGLQQQRFSNASTALQNQARRQIEVLQAQADASNDENEKQKIQGQIKDIQNKADKEASELALAAAIQAEKSLARQQQFERESLAIKQQIARAEAENLAIQQEIALLESKTALSEARRNNASQEEIANLEQIVGLRSKALESANGNIGRLDQLQQLERQEVGVNQQTAREQASFNRSEAEKDLRDDKGNFKDERTSLERTQVDTSIVADASQFEINTQGLATSFDQSLQSMLTQVSAGEALIAGEIRSLGRGGSATPQQSLEPGQVSNTVEAVPGELEALTSQIRALSGGLNVPQDQASIAREIREKPVMSPETLSVQATLAETSVSTTGSGVGGNTDVVAGIKQLETAILALANSPRNLSVTTPDPVEDTRQILRDVAEMSTQGVNA